MPRVRFQPPDRQLGATAFSLDDAVRGSLNVVHLVKSRPWLANALRDACDLDKNWGRDRNGGRWDLAAIAFVVSGHVDIQPWHDSTTDELWRACEFAAKPTYRTTWRRLRELEEVAEAFLDGAGSLVRRAREHDSRVMAHVHFDNTEDETHAGLVHDCPRGECPRPAKVAPQGVDGRAPASDRCARARRPFASSASS